MWCRWGLSANVAELHEKLFQETEYQPSEKVQQINDDIIYLTGVTEDAESLQTTFDADVSAGSDGAE